MARPFFRAAIASLQHAYSHSEGTSPGDLAQVLISLDHMADMLLKAALLERGESIFDRPGHTLDLHKELKKVDSSYAAEIEVIHEQRNQVQHFFAYAQSEEIAELLETGWSFAEEIAHKELGVDLAAETSIRPPEIVASPTQGAPVEPTESVQRDPSTSRDVLVWSDGRSGDLRVRLRTTAGSRWLSPDDSFEYMPVTNGRLIAAYRQSGGIVLYDPASDTRTLLTETGGPGDISDEFVVAQGLGVSGGLGGGIWLVPIDGSEPELISEEGDSPRIRQDDIYWQELVDDVIALRMRRLSGGASETIRAPAIHADVHSGLVTWNDAGGWPTVRAQDLETGEERVISKQAIFPHTRRRMVAFLEHKGPRDEKPALRYDLVIYDWAREGEILRVSEVGFPTGRGPVLGDDRVYWEMADERRLTQIWECPLPS